MDVRLGWEDLENAASLGQTSDVAGGSRSAEIAEELHGREGARGGASKRQELQHPQETEASHHAELAEPCNVLQKDMSSRTAAPVNTRPQAAAPNSKPYIVLSLFGFWEVVSKVYTVSIQARNHQPQWPQ